MRIEEIIRKKRDGIELSETEIGFFVTGLANDSVPREQTAALAMAIFFRSMTEDEISALTLAMARSGEIIDWTEENLPGPIVDKHSTGGVGDKVSFALAPIAAACGCFTPMISGRGLGHSGGTLDKIEAIPGYTTQPDVDLFKRTVKTIGCAIIGQTGALAPADRRLYAIRDITATVESIPLITASILSKKIARALAQSIVETGAKANLKTRALITDMSEPLGQTAGNAIEIREIVDYLSNTEREPRLDGVVKALCAEMLLMTGIESDQRAAEHRIEKTITSGQAAEIFGKMITALGGPADFMEASEKYLPKPKLTAPVPAPEKGYLATVDARRIGTAIVDLGGGRSNVDDVLDLSVGFSEIAAIGEEVGNDRPLAMVHAATQESLERAILEYQKACTITPAPPPEKSLIYETLS